MARARAEGSPPVPARVVLRGLTKRYDPRGPAQVDRVDLVVEPGTMTALLGPSGCGKTTTLKMLAGLVDPTEGDVLLDGASIVGLPPEHRGIAMVFQKPLLFPHLSVADNVGFGLRMRGVPRSERRRRVAEMLDLVRLPGLEGRRADELSGGQEQRVSLARALVVRPRVLLLDEPLSQLDAALRVEMRDLVRRVQQELRVTAVFVTHDQEEAVVLADRVALVLGGRVEQEDVPEAFYDRPRTVAAAVFFGTRNLLPGTVDGQRWSGLFGHRPAPGLADGPAVLAVRQESLVVDRDVRPGDVAAVVEVTRYLGTSQSVQLCAADQVLHAVVPPTVKLAPGDVVGVGLPDGHGHVIAEPEPPALGGA